MKETKRRGEDNDDEEKEENEEENKRMGRSIKQGRRNDEEGFKEVKMG